jgi:hypothetical protein
MVKRKSYINLCKERDAVMDEINNWKENITVCKRIGLWNDSTYLDELLYIKSCIEKEMIPYEVVFRMKFYENMYKTIPEDIVLHIASFGDLIDQSAHFFLSKGVKSDINCVDPL